MLIESLVMEKISSNIMPQLKMGSILACKGEIVGIIGLENSGHTSAFDILTGKISTQSGEIWIDGEMCIHKGQTIDKRWNNWVWTLKIDTELPPSMSVSEYVNCPILKQEFKLFINETENRRKAEILFDKMGVSIPVDSRTGDLSLAERHIVYILRAVCKGAKVLAIDDVVYLYSPEEISALAKLLRCIVQNGITVVCKFNNVCPLTKIVDRLVIFRNGRSIKELYQGQISREMILRFEEYNPFTEELQKPAEREEPLCALNVNVEIGNMKRYEFSVGYGEVVLLIAKDQQDRSILMDKLMSAAKGRRISGIQVYENGKHNKRCFIIPEMAAKRCVFDNLSIADNICIPRYELISTGSFINNRIIRFLDRNFKDALPQDSAYKSVSDLNDYENYMLLFNRFTMSKASILILENPQLNNDDSICTFILKQAIQAAIHGKAVLIITNSHYGNDESYSRIYDFTTMENQEEL